MSTIGGLLMPQFKPYDLGGTLEQANRIAGGATNNQTALLQLADMKQKQEAEQLMLERIKNDPALAQQLLGGGSILGSLGPGGGQGGAGGQPGAGPITQSPLGGGPAQQIPAYPDASQFATQGGPPQSTIASLGPAGQPQGQVQPQQNPVLAMAQQNPRAALMLQQQMQTQQDRQWKMQEQQLGMGVKVLGYVAQQAQGVTDQASLDTMRTDLQSSGLGKYAAQLPQFYSKEAMEPFIARGSTAKDRAETLYHEAKARNLDMETRMFPELAKRFGMEGEAQAPAGEAAPGTATAPQPGQQARTAPAEYENAITEANRLYPQVSTTRIKSMIAAESNYDRRAESNAGAKGPMQLMDATAKDMGVDDPFDIQQNVRGGTRYYDQLLTKYGGDERKALTAYNWGPKNLDDAGGDVTKAPAETKAYVAKVLGGGGGGAATGTAQAAATDPRIAGLEAKIAQRTRDAQIASLMKNESLSTRLNDDANRLKDEKNRLIDESRRQQERAEEIPRALDRERQLTEQKQNLERQRQAGPLLPEDRRKLLTGLRTDIRAEPTFKLYQDVRNGYQNVRIGAQTDSGQGDLAIINGMAKILDPNSTVMSGEARNVETAQGELERWFNSPQRFFTGDRLTPENRQRFLKLAHAMATEKLTTARTELTSVYGPLAQEGKIEMGQLLPMEDLKPLGAGPNVEKFEKLVAP
jgi:soluble lytic murein transglycosylase-like protein